MANLDSVRNSCGTWTKPQLNINDRLHSSPHANRRRRRVQTEQEQIVLPEASKTPGPQSEACPRTPRGVPLPAAPLFPKVRVSEFVRDESVIASGRGSVLYLPTSPAGDRSQPDSEIDRMILEQIDDAELDVALQELQDPLHQAQPSLTKECLLSIQPCARHGHKAPVISSIRGLSRTPTVPGSSNADVGSEWGKAISSLDTDSQVESDDMPSPAGSEPDDGDQGAADSEAIATRTTWPTMNISLAAQRSGPWACLLQAMLLPTTESKAPGTGPSKGMQKLSFAGGNEANVANVASPRPLPPVQGYAECAYTRRITSEFPMRTLQASKLHGFNSCAFTL